MSVQLRMGKGAELPAIDISFGRQFLVPTILLIVSILGISTLLDNDTATDSTYLTSTSISPAVVNRLQREVATLEGESQRLKEFAKRMVTLAKLDKNTFNFDKPPGRGGLGGRNIFQRYTSEVTAIVSKDLDSLSRGFLRRSHQFERMQLALRSKILGESERILKWPVATGYISSNYGMRKDPFTGRLRKHNGMDLAGPRGSDIYSVAKGEVIFTGRKGGYGRVVEVKHIDGYVSRYAHLEASVVKKGQIISVGEKIARLGTSGRSTGPHLHLEILKNNKHINPLVFLGRTK